VLYVEQLKQAFQDYSIDSLNFMKTEHEIIKNLQGLEREISGNISKNTPKMSHQHIEIIYKSKMQKYFSAQKKRGHPLETMVLECKEEQN
jgi:hypothetical protein